jgi:hypothetical protein
MGASPVVPHMTGPASRGAFSFLAFVVRATQLFSDALIAVHVSPGEGDWKLVTLKKRILLLLS